VPVTHWPLYSRPSGHVKAPSLSHVLHQTFPVDGAIGSAPAGLPLPMAAVLPEGMCPIALPVHMATVLPTGISPMPSALWQRQSSPIRIEPPSTYSPAAQPPTSPSLGGGVSAAASPIQSTQIPSQRPSAAAARACALAAAAASRLSSSMRPGGGGGPKTGRWAVPPEPVDPPTEWPRTAVPDPLSSHLYVMPMPTPRGTAPPSARRDHPTSVQVSL